MATVEYIAWRTAVFTRDKWTCRMCGKTTSTIGGKEKRWMQADHIMPWAWYPHLRYEVSNGRTLCLQCHRSTFKSNFRLRPKQVIRRRITRVVERRHIQSLHVI
jgi:5-methylcytosine-specific restriction endonuclease McrA